jgi:hypothetical protein
MRSLSLFAAFLFLFGLACTLSPQPTQTPWVVTATPIPATQTPWVIIATAEAQPTTAVPPAAAPTQQPTVAPPTATATRQPTIPAQNAPPPTSAALLDAQPPNMLGPGYTGVIFNIGDCFDMDQWGMVHDGRCDFRLDPNLIITPVNGALLSGHGRMAAPSLATCRGDALLAAPLAPNSNIYLCARTNLGAYGFIVQRPDSPFAPAGRMIFDYWIYR